MEYKFGDSLDKKALTLISLVVLGAFTSLIASSSGFQSHDVLLEADNGSLKVFVSQVTISGEIMPIRVNNKNMIRQKISEMHAINLRIEKDDAWGSLEIKASEAEGAGITLWVDVEDLENEGFGYFFRLLIEENKTIFLKNSILKNVELPVENVFSQTVTLYGMELSIR